MKLVHIKHPVWYFLFIYIARICSDHFDSSCYKEQSWTGALIEYSPKKGIRKLKPDAVPTEFINDEYLMGAKIDFGKCRTDIKNFKAAMTFNLYSFSFRIEIV